MLQLYQYLNWKLETTKFTCSNTRLLQHSVTVDAATQRLLDTFVSRRYHHFFSRPSHDSVT